MFKMDLMDAYKVLKPHFTEDLFLPSTITDLHEYLSSSICINHGMIDNTIKLMVDTSNIEPDIAFKSYMDLLQLTLYDGDITKFKSIIREAHEVLGGYISPELSDALYTATEDPITTFNLALIDMGNVRIQETD